MSAGHAGALLHAMDIEVRVEAVEGKTPMWVSSEVEAGNWIFDSVQNFVRDVFSGRVQVDRDRVESNSFTRYLACFAASTPQYANMLQGDLNVLAQRLQADLQAKFGVDHKPATVRITPIRAFISESSSMQPGGYGGAMMSSQYFNQGPQPPYGGGQMPAPYQAPNQWGAQQPWQQQGAPPPPPPPGNSDDDSKTVIKGRSVAVLGAVMGGSMLAAIAFGAMAWFKDDELEKTSALLTQLRTDYKAQGELLASFQGDAEYDQSQITEIERLTDQLRNVATGKQIKFTDLAVPTRPDKQKDFTAANTRHIEWLKGKIEEVRKRPDPPRRAQRLPQGN